MYVVLYYSSEMYFLSEEEMSFGEILNIPVFPFGRLFASRLMKLKFLIPVFDFVFY